LDEQQASIEQLRNLIQEEAKRLYTQAIAAVEDLHQTIGTLSLDGTLRRGFVAALNGREVLRNKAAAQACSSFDLLFADGSLRVSNADFGRPAGCPHGNYNENKGKNIS
jgi:exonuclease VII large subunit